ncbi:MAG: nitronate monooxygenase [Sulfobacillus thermotolerans]|nr:nitronate monooxygenase [Sulfobacillus thermotolerans]
MIATRLTHEWTVRYPLVCAPMLGVSGGKLAAAVHRGGGLGFIAVGPINDGDWLAHEAQMVPTGTPFGVGLIAWDLLRRPELLDQVIRVQPSVISISFGSVAPYVKKIHEHGIRIVTQVNTVDEGLNAQDDGVDAVVVQGCEAGGHTGRAPLWPVLQALVGQIEVPLLAAGGIATPQGVAAALMGGADGVWVGTRFMASYESLLPESVIHRICQAGTTTTILTSLFDNALNVPWPARYPGRVLPNIFTDQWLNRPLTNQARTQLQEGITNKDPELMPVYAGMGVGFVTHRERAADIVRDLMEGACTWWKTRQTLFTVGE